MYQESQREGERHYINLGKASKGNNMDMEGSGITNRNLECLDMSFLSASDAENWLDSLAHTTNGTVTEAGVEMMCKLEFVAASQIAYWSRW